MLFNRDNNSRAVSSQKLYIKKIVFNYAKNFNNKNLNQHKIQA